MLKVEKLLEILNEIAPFSLSEDYIKSGGYDNSGLLIKCKSEVVGVLFGLDLTLDLVKKAKKLKCDTIITHHPAIYQPLKNLSIDDLSSAPVIEAIKSDINVISTHINLDMAKEGIDQCLSVGLGGENQRIITKIEGEDGYGRIAQIKCVKPLDFIKKVKETFGADRVIFYGDKNKEITKIASFCGGGSQDAHRALLEGKLDADVVVTSDMPHHVIKDLVLSGYQVLLLTHYTAENYGFSKFFDRVTSIIKDEVKTYYFCDKRFK